MMTSLIRAVRLRIEDLRWEWMFWKHRKAIAARARALENAPTLPLFDESGRWLLDDYTEADFAEAHKP